MDTIGDKEAVKKYLPIRDYEWDGMQSSLRLMNQIFKPVLSLCAPSLLSGEETAQKDTSQIIPL